MPHLTPTHLTNPSSTITTKLEQTMLLLSRTTNSNTVSSSATRWHSLFKSSTTLRFWGCSVSFWRMTTVPSGSLMLIKLRIAASKTRTMTQRRLNKFHISIRIIKLSLCVSLRSTEPSNWRKETKILIRCLTLWAHTMIIWNSNSGLEMRLLAAAKMRKTPTLSKWRSRRRNSGQKCDRNAYNWSRCSLIDRKFRLTLFMHQIVSSTVKGSLPTLSSQALMEWIIISLIELAYALLIKAKAWLTDSVYPKTSFLRLSIGEDMVDPRLLVIALSRWSLVNRARNLPLWTALVLKRISI